MSLTLEQLNLAGGGEAARMLEGLYEHSPWIGEAVLAHRPFKSLAHLKCMLARIVGEAGRDAQLALVRAHPPLASRAGQPLTTESTSEQRRAGLGDCTPAQLDRLRELNADYLARFGFPFVLAVRGPRGNGLARSEIIGTFERRMDNPADVELAESLRNIHRIAELRLNDKFAAAPELGNRVWDWLEDLAQHSDPGYREQGQLTVTYLTDAHRQVAAGISQRMRESGFDEVTIDAVGNVVGVYFRNEQMPATSRRLLTGSHYDTVRNGGKYDGRLGVMVPLACVRELARQGKRLPFDVEVVAFAEEEGQRYHATFLGSGALTGSFDAAWLEQTDANGVTMREAMRHAGLPATAEAIAALRRDPSRYLGFVEVHIEQGPVLAERDLPLGIVTSINGGVRLRCEIAGMASHAGTTPMDRRRDAVSALAELALYIEQRAARDGDSVGTIGMLNVPGGSINVVPGRCLFTLDLRSPTDAQRDALVKDVLDQLDAICARRGVRCSLEQTMQVAAAPSAREWQARWEAAVAALGLTRHLMTSGAGHDSMKLHQVMPQAMLFVRGQNMGISHNPLESTTSDDIQLAIEAFGHLLGQLAAETARQ